MGSSRTCIEERDRVFRRQAVKVLLDARMREGGVGRYAEDLVAGFETTGTDLVLHVVRGTWGRTFTPWGRSALARRAHRENVDLIHGLHFELPESGAIPGVVTMPDAIPLDHPAAMPSPNRRAYFKSIVVRSAARANAIVTVSKLSADSLAQHGVPLAKVKIVPLGVGPIFTPGDGSLVQEARNRFAEGERYVAAVADDKPHKNIDLLSAIASDLPSGVRLLCRGHTARPVTDVSFLPQLSDSDLRLFYVGADALVMPSFVEGFGLPALEAAACGIPVVCGDAVGVCEFLDGATVVDVHNPKSVVDAVGNLLNDEAERSDRGRLLRAAAQTMTVEAMSRATAAIYRAVLS